MAVATGSVELDFDDWYRTEWPRLVASLAMACGDRELARWPRVSRMASPGGWTYRVAVNLLRRRHGRADAERRAVLRASSGSPRR